MSDEDKFESAKRHLRVALDASDPVMLLSTYRAMRLLVDDPEFGDREWPSDLMERARARVIAFIDGGDDLPNEPEIRTTR